MKKLLWLTLPAIAIIITTFILYHAVFIRKNRKDVASLSIHESQPATPSSTELWDRPSLLNHYTKNEFTCGMDKWAHSYTLFHRQHVDRSSNGTNYLISPCKKGYSSCAGLGDRLVGIVSTFYMALLTNRVFLIQFEQPVELEKILAPNMIDWRFGVREHHIRDLPSEDQRWMMLGYQKRRALFLEGDFTLKMEKQVQYVRSNERLYTHLHNNPLYKKRREELGLDRMSSFHIFGCLYQYLFKPSVTLYNFIQDFYNSAFLNSLNQRIPVIGMQIRTGTALGEHQRITRPELQTMWDCAQKLLQHHPNSRILLTTDSSLIKDEAKSLFKEQLIEMDLPVQHIDKVPIGDEISLRNTVAELVLLSMCDHFIVSRSNFGEVASMINFKPRFKIPIDQCDLNVVHFEFERFNQIHHETFEPSVGETAKLQQMGVRIERI